MRVRWCRVVQVNALRPLDEYKQLEADLNAMGNGVTRRASDEQLPALQARWRGVASQPKDPGAYTSFGAEVVEQMLVGAGWRVCARHRGVGTESVLVRSADPRGVRFIVTALLDGATLTPSEATAKASAVRVLPHLTAGESPPLPLSPPELPHTATICTHVGVWGGRHQAEPEPFDHFAPSHVERFLSCHAGKPGVAVLAFQAPSGGLDAVGPALAVWLQLDYFWSWLLHLCCTSCVPGVLRARRSD